MAWSPEDEVNDFGFCWCERKRSLKLGKTNKQTKKVNDDDDLIIQNVTGLNYHQINTQNIYTHSRRPPPTPPSTQTKDNSHLDTTDTAVINK